MSNLHKLAACGVILLQFIGYIDCGKGPRSVNCVKRFSILQNGHKIAITCASMETIKLKR